MSKPAAPKSGGKKERKTIDKARPSASVLLISPTNQILLLHRVRTSSTSPSAHVFPGGNCDPFHDGPIPDEMAPDRHEDSACYRMAAVRETFEESGILLAHNNGFGRLIEVEDSVRAEGRKKVHSKEVEFGKWLAGQGGRADVDNLIPFTRWITPTHMPKRFTTQMYIYFLPLATPTTNTTPGLPSTSTSTSTSTQAQSQSQPQSKDAVIPIPTHDGGLEHTEARFAPATSWITAQTAGEVILYPPQLFLLHLIARHLPSPPSPTAPFSHAQLSAQRTALKHFIRTSDPPWGQKVISPAQLLRRKSEGRTVLALDKPGVELEGSGRRGDDEHVVLVDYRREGPGIVPRDVEVRMKGDVLEEERAGGGASKL